MLERKDGRWRSRLTEEEHEARLAGTIGAMSEQERGALSAFLADEAGDQNPVLRAIMELEYDVKPVTPAQFYSDDYYLGALQLWPRLREDLVELHEGGYEEAILTGSLGWGKSYFSAAAMSYVLYQLSCLRNPQRSYGLDQTSQVYLVFVGPTLQLAQRSLYSKIVEFVKQSPYFNDHFPPKAIKSTTWFPKGITMIAGSTQSNAGMALDVFGGAIDEANFFKGQRSESDLRVMQDRAKIIYEAISRRMKNRFMRSGRLPGLLLVDSSARHQSSFTAQKVGEARFDPTIFVRDYATWQVQPPDRFIGRRFWVAVGDSNVHSRIMEAESEAREYEKLGANVHDVPVEFKEEFDRDLESAIQDILGIPTSDVSFYIQNRGAVSKAAAGQWHPFVVKEHVVGVTKDLYRWSAVTRKVKRKDRDGREREEWVPLVNPDAPRAVHLDLSKSADATGLAIGHIDRYVDVVRRDPKTGEAVTETAPIVRIDAMLRILPPPGRDIILADVRMIVYAFQEHGFHIYMGTCDQYQSLDTLQQFEARGMRSEVLSMDKDSEQYDVFKSALYEGRIKAYHYEPWLSELASLRRVVTRSSRVKIDHPADPKDGATSKDVADAVTGVVYTLTKNPPGRLPSSEPAGIVGPFAGGGVDADALEEEDAAEGDPMPFLLGGSRGPEDQGQWR